MPDTPLCPKEQLSPQNGNDVCSGGRAWFGRRCCASPAALPGAGPEGAARLRGRGCRHHAVRRSGVSLALLLLAGLALQGCAQFPEDAGQIQARRRMTVSFNVAGRINPLYYYFIAIDTEGNPSAGPVPVVSSPWGNGWVTGRVTHFVQYHLGVFTVYQMREGSSLLVADSIGPPFEYNQPDAGAGNLVRVVLDQDTLGTDLNQINLNLIATDRIIIEPTFQGTKLYDGLGTSGNSFVTLPVDISQTFTNAQSLDPERAGDLPPQPGGGVVVNDLDITDWMVDARINQ